MRALAILAVVAFHAFPEFLPGGFIGVDVFFVISGYLITRHILDDISTGTYRTAGFYAKRVKRIFPALIVVLFVTIALGWLILTPEEYESLGRHVISGAGFFANIQNWKEAGYFDRAADTKPLLHLWSLGVEEQFYIVWPLIIAFLMRRTGMLLKGMLACVVLSLVFSILTVTVLRDATADFYSPLTRFWELAIGAMVAYVTLYRPGFASRHRPLLAWAGILLTIAGMLVLQPDYTFPGAWALLPTVGTALLILAGASAPCNRLVLAAAPLVWIGLISYPLYLWHWPLLSLARILEGATPSVTTRIWVIAASVVLAWATYRFVELPLRTATGRIRKWVVPGLCMTMAALLAIGVVIKKQDGFHGRLDGLLNGDVSTLGVGADRTLHRKECGVPANLMPALGYCLTSGTGAPRYAVLGDSKAEALFYGLARELPADQPGALIGTAIPPAAHLAASDPAHAVSQSAVQSVLASPSIKLMIWVVALRNTLPTERATGFVAPDGSPKEVLDFYGAVIRQASEAGKRVMIVIDNPTLPDPRSCVFGPLTTNPSLANVLRRNQDPRCTLRYSEHLAGTAPYRALIGELRRRYPELLVYDPTPKLCDIANDRCGIVQDGKFLYSYTDHISDFANSMIARDMSAELMSVLAPGVAAETSNTGRR